MAKARSQTLESFAHKQPILALCFCKSLWLIHGLGRKQSLTLFHKFRAVLGLVMPVNSVEGHQFIRRDILKLAEMKMQAMVDLPGTNQPLDEGNN
ncbi:unnamed protein product [Absidia cylindrospora]